jgi:hypothetical protein
LRDRSRRWNEDLHQISEGIGRSSGSIRSDFSATTCSTARFATTTTAIYSEPAGQIAAREMKIVRIKGALQRADELSDDVAAAIERAL